MQLNRRIFRVDRKEINYLRSTIESYDGIGMVSTLDPFKAYIEVRISPGCEELVFELLDSLKKEEGLEIKEMKGFSDLHGLKGEKSEIPSKYNNRFQQGAFFIKTMGCQMNKYDSDYLRRSLINRGLFPVSEPEDADIILINTCTVRAKPEQKAYSLLGRLSPLKKKKPGLILGIVGCLAQQQGAALIKRFPGLDLVMGPRDIGRIDEIIDRIVDNREKVVATNLKPLPPELVPTKGYFKGNVTGFISIMEGCNNFCTYCIVPFVRGREVSRSPEQVLLETKNLTSEGIKDITLLGQNVNSYLWDGGGRWDFPFLLRELSKTKGLLRLRFTTSHPKDLSDDLIQCFGDLVNLCPHIHLPFQAGSDQVLKRMGRGYTREKYMQLIRKLRTVRPDVAITSDVMVGFPGESETDFEMTLDLIRQVQFDSLFSFKYSDRKGTLAQKMPDKVDKAEKSKRLSILQDLQKWITLKKNKSLEGEQVEVLVEGKGKGEGQLTGRTGSNKIVNFTCNDNLIGQLVNVVIKEGLFNSLRGEILEGRKTAHQNSGRNHLNQFSENSVTVKTLWI